MRRQRLRLTFPEALITEPVIYSLGKRFDVVTDVRRAEIHEGTGWALLELTGTAQRLGEARRHLEQLGVRVDEVESYLE